MKCLICGKEFKSITLSHLKLHNMTFDDYRSKFPEAELVNEEEKKKRSERAKKQHQEMDKDPNSKFGFKPGHKINAGKIPWCKGLTKETDDRVASISDKAKGRKLTTEQKKILSEKRKQYYKDNPDKIPRGSNNGMYGKKLSPKHKEALHKARYDYNKMNKVESKMFDIIKHKSFIYTGDRRYWIDFKNGHHKNPDFINEKDHVVIEVYGDYWHRNDNPQDIIDEYKKVGWDCYVVWEHEINDGYDIDSLEQTFGIWEFEEFTYEDFNGEWML